MFYLAVVLEKDQIVDRGLDSENEAELSYTVRAFRSLIDTGPMVCLIRVPSMRMLKRFPISPSNCVLSLRPRKVAMRLPTQACCPA